MYVLHIEDDDAMAHAVARMFARERFRSRRAIYGEEGIALAAGTEFNIIVLDLQLPDMSGFEVIKTLRKQRIDTPIVVLSGNPCVEAKVKALGMGADDYMVKPFHKDELIARIQAIIRRTLQGKRGYCIHTGPIAVHITEEKVTLAGKRLRVPWSEYQLLRLLSLRKGMTLTHEALFDHLYQGRDEPKQRKIVDVFICRLRKRLGDAERCIGTDWGRGYVLLEPKDC